MREYNHVYYHGEIMTPDPTSARAKYGTHYHEYMNPEQRHWLREGHTTFPRHETVYQLSEPSGPACMNDNGGFVIVEMQGCDGFFSEGAIHQSKVIWEKSTP